MDVSLVWLVVWGTMVGLDLASVGQFMIARPLVAGAVAGALAGDPMSGLVVGVILELFALEVLPFGAARYPDYGLGAVAAAATAAGAPGVLGTGVGVAVGLIVAYLGEISIQMVRHRTSLDIRRHEEEIDAGDPVAIARAHFRGLARDAVRAVTLTGVGLGLAALVRWQSVLEVGEAVLLGAVVLGVALGTTFASGWRIAGGSRQRLAWWAIGLAGGLAWVVVR